MHQSFFSPPFSLHVPTHGIVQPELGAGPPSVAVESNRSTSRREVPVFALLLPGKLASRLHLLFPLQTLEKRAIAFDSKCPRKLAFLFSPPLKHPSQRTAPSSVAAAADPLAEEDKRTVSVRNVPSAASSCIHINKF